ncbi:hypothetical protein AB1Y20_011693 [Prymnesium parvum]|uniref:SCP2 domain-containing protein n=1 Tax=Prymnesium parvum TaxID=97485 RepID=A0AB34IJV2_PRYPA
MGFSSPEDVFTTLRHALVSDPALGGKVGGCLQFVITHTAGPSEWFVDAKAAVVKSEKAAHAQCTITISEADFMAMAAGKLTGMAAFMGGKMKLKGNMGLAQKFNTLIDVARKMDAPAAAAAAAAPAAAPAAVPAEAAGFESARVFAQIGARLGGDPSLLRKVNGVFLFHITGGAGGATSTWTVDAKTDGTVTAGEGAKPDCTITISDANFMAMASGKLTGMAAFMGGKMKLKGNMGLAQKFGALLDSSKSKL